MSTQSEIYQNIINAALDIAVDPQDSLDTANALIAGLSDDDVFAYTEGTARTDLTLSQIEMLACLVLRRVIRREIVAGIQILATQGAQSMIDDTVAAALARINTTAADAGNPIL